MRFFQIIAALICAFLLCIPVSADDLPEQTEKPETADGFGTQEMHQAKAHTASRPGTRKHR